MAVDPMMLAQALQQGPQAQQAPAGEDPLSYLQECIDGIHHLVTQLPDAGHTQMAVQALAILTKIQRDLMGAQAGGPNGSQAR